MRKFDNQHCLFHHSTEKRRSLPLDSAFMGFTHALSGLAFCLMVVGFLPDIVDRTLRTDHWALIVLSCITVIGGSLWPDMDNTNSYSRNSLGPIGFVLSEGFRAVSVFIQTIVRTSKDNTDADPHRGFFHTIVGSALLSFLVFLGTKIGGEFNIPVYGKMTGGAIFSLILCATMLHISFSALTKQLFKKMKDIPVVGDLMAYFSAVVIVSVFFYFAPLQEDYYWLAVSFFVGNVVHIIADCFTTAGCPILFPLSGFIKGKFWWNTRFLPIKAGGVVETTVFLPIFSLLCAAGFFKIIGIF